MLREFSDALLATNPSYAVQLVVTEPGYMHVSIGYSNEDPVGKLIITTDSNDGVNWYYLYHLRNVRDAISELEFRQDHFGDAIAALDGWRV